MAVAKALVALAALAASPVSALWPIPKELSMGNSTLWIDQDIRITFNGQFMSYTYGYEPPAGTHFVSSQIVQGGVSRALDDIFDKNFVPWKLRPRNSDWEPSVWGPKTFIRSLNITQTQPDKPGAFKPLDGQVDESYSLDVTSQGEASITANSTHGVLHGLESFSQLFFQHSSGTFWYTQDAPVSISDTPEYVHRGVLLDTARSFYNVDAIKRTIDAISWNKMNRLHWHITDSQSWPLEVPSLPLLSEKGAYGSSAVYTTQDVADIYEYGVHRGVEVIMEIDMPGHIGVVELAYKDLITAYNAQPYFWWCDEPPCGQFRMNSSKVYDFLDQLFADLLPRISPYTAYFHTGGDEINKNDSRLDPTVGTNATDVIQPLLSKFVHFAHSKVRQAGLTPLCWEELVVDWNITLDNTTIVQSWLGNGAVKTLAEAGHPVIDSNYNYWYLDCGRGQWLNFANGEAFKQFFPFLDWCDPTKNWRVVYSNDPRAGLSGEAAKRVLGGEVAIWSETIDPTTLDSLLWPRGSAAGEVLWSGRQDAQGHNRSQVTAAPRLNEWRERMVARGIGAAVVQMPFCTQHGPEECTYPEP